MGNINFFNHLFAIQVWISISSFIRNKDRSGRLNNKMVKYKIELQYLFGNKSFSEITSFLEQYPAIDLREVKDNKNNTALHQIAYNCTDIKILKKYLDYMQKYCCKNDKENPQLAFRQFVNIGNNDGMTALHFAAYKGNFRAMQLLLHYGADYKKQNNSKQNVLHMAAQGGAVEAFIFFQSLIDINSKDIKESTPLHWACFMNNESIVTFLLANKNIEIDSLDIKKQTPLLIASMYGHTKIVRKLLRAGADRNIANQKNETALQIAKQNEFKNIERILNDSHSCFDSIKIYLNIKTVHRLEKRSYSKPILFLFTFFIVLILKILLIKTKQQNKFIEYIEYSLFGLAFLSYISLLKAPKRKLPQKYIDFLNGNISMKKVCLACADIKPNRSFHCDICRVCVQRYDHHCFWINNCVGKNNIGRFIFFIFSFLLLLLYMLFISIIVILNFFEIIAPAIIAEAKQNLGSFATAYCFILFFLTLGFAIPMIFLNAVQIKNLLLNKTTYERFTKDKITSLTESTSHLLEDQIKNTRNRKYSLSNARTMCRDEEHSFEESEVINSSLAEDK